MQKLGLGLKHTEKAVKGKFLLAVRWSTYSSEEVWDHDDLQNTKQNILFPSRVRGLDNSTAQQKQIKLLSNRFIALCFSSWHRGQKVGPPSFTNCNTRPLLWDAPWE